MSEDVEKPCLEAFADYEAAQVLCAIACSSETPEKRDTYLKLAAAANKEANKNRVACNSVTGSENDPDGGKCKPPKFFDPITGEEKSLGDYAGQSCCCDIPTMSEVDCSEIDDCDENGLDDAQEIAEDPSLDEDEDGVLDSCQEE